ncbi:hypothetical protein [Flavobacterium gilvum]|uniref:Lipoprotein n=1 Tax=Flavobacterium gilvum TaxID=1492737 RepID=A0AAC9N6I4_9FLAO|nr:hypothetical protein [Flavobacterium gilvum]AOW08893.1 hypothetical protein EM308_04885 [Flavobacterium gilvum]KFC59005.1 hypothetical protein FEM08_22170 [Flavobacterium gilvum]
MKQIATFFLFLASMLAFQSCTNDEMQEETLKTTSVVITTHSSYLTAKNVNDPFLYGNIKDITVTATQITTGYKANTVFTISNNPNDFSTYRIDLVQEGINTFTANATSVTQPVVPGYSSVPRNDSNSKIWNTIDAKVANPPYATYSGFKGETVINHNIPTTLSIDMNTNNGRFIAYFRGSPRPFETTVTPYIDEVPQAEFVITSVNDFYWIWNDSDCVAGKTVRFHCIERNNGGNIKSVVDIPNVTIKSHTTSKFAYDIDETGDTFTSIPRI